jgi:NAD(P)-dependent dehydrogenase (short-subunit alcohol dehydrogenase family)
MSLDIKKATGFTAELIIVDLSDLASISALATSFQKTYNRLDVLVCNAGIVAESYETTKDGWESRWVNSRFFLNQCAQRFILCSQHSSQSPRTFNDYSSSPPDHG